MAVENENKLSEVIQAFADAGFINDVILIGSSFRAFRSLWISCDARSW